MNGKEIKTRFNLYYNYNTSSYPQGGDSAIKKGKDEQKVDQPGTGEEEQCSTAPKQDTASTSQEPTTSTSNVAGEDNNKVSLT